MLDNIKLNELALMLALVMLNYACWNELHCSQSNFFFTD